MSTWSGKTLNLSYDTIHLDNIISSEDGSTMASMHRIYSDPNGGGIIQQLRIYNYKNNNYQHIQTIDSLDYHLSLDACPGSGVTYNFSESGDILATVSQGRDFEAPRF